MFATLRTVTAAAQVFFNPDDTERVFTLLDGMLTADKRQDLLDVVHADPRIVARLERRPRLGEIDVAALAALPEGTFGHAFATFLNDNGLDPALLTDEAADQDGFVLQHLFESHDIWHVVTGMGSDIAGEAGLQAFYLAQINGSASGLLIALVLLRAVVQGDDQRALLDSVARGWHMGKTAEPLTGVCWAELWERPLEAVRRDLGIHRAA